MREDYLLCELPQTTCPLTPMGPKASSSIKKVGAQPAGLEVYVDAMLTRATAADLLHTNSSLAPLCVLLAFPSF